jgi:hypothetical protein
MISKLPLSSGQNAELSNSRFPISCLLNEITLTFEKIKVKNLKWAVKPYHSSLFLLIKSLVSLMASAFHYLALEY